MENNQEIKPKGIMDYIAEDAALSRKMTFEEFNSSTITGVDDSGIEEAYKAYCKIINETGVKPKGFAEYLDEDPSLKGEMTFEEFNSSTKAGIDDSGIEEAYKAYRKIIDGQVKK